MRERGGSTVKTANPGSWGAILHGCRCDRLANNDGIWMMRRWTINPLCPTHGPDYLVKRDVREVTHA